MQCKNEIQAMPKTVLDIAKYVDKYHEDKHGLPMYTAILPNTVCTSMSLDM